jgi:hypothetical protein
LIVLDLGVGGLGAHPEVGDMPAQGFGFGISQGFSGFLRVQGFSGFLRGFQGLEFVRTGRRSEW